MLYEVITTEFLDAPFDLGQRVLAGPLLHDDDHCFSPFRWWGLAKVRERLKAARFPRRPFRSTPAETKKPRVAMSLPVVCLVEKLTQPSADQSPGKPAKKAGKP